MAYAFGNLLFSPAVKALQERFGSRSQYARLQERGRGSEGLGPDERAFLAERDSFYIASIGSNGWPYVQHRGGPKGFLKVVDDVTLAFADFRGNKQYISVGNLATDDRVALILVDYPNRARLKVLGRASVVEGSELDTWRERLQAQSYSAVVERVFVIRVEAFDWNCPQHITPRFSSEEIQAALAPIERRLEELERENAELRAKVANVGQ